MVFSLYTFLRAQLFTTLPECDASFAGQTAIVTGANTGLGMEAARHLVRLGAERVVLGVRNVEAGEVAAKSIGASTGRPGVCEVWPLDLGSYASVKAFAARAEASLPRLDAVLENAGVATHRFETCPDAGGHERTIAVNVVCTFLLALLLLPKLRASGREGGGAVFPRLSIVASDAHSFTAFDERAADPLFPALSDPERAEMSVRYPVSKLLEIMAVRQLAPLVDADGVRVNCCNPGLCHSELLREAGGVEALFLGFLKRLVARTPQVGAGLLVTALAAGRATHGKFVSEGVVTEPDFELVRSDDGEATARRVWAELSAILEGIQPGITGNLKG